MRQNPKSMKFAYNHPLLGLPADSKHGFFMIPCHITGAHLAVQASEGDEDYPWEHVSVSCATRCPTWGEMDFIKRIFWRDDETVLQFHVPRQRHINNAEFCLHLWRPWNTEIPLPPAVMV